MQSTKLSTENFQSKQPRRYWKGTATTQTEPIKKNTQKKQETKGNERLAGMQLDTVWLRPTIPLLIIQSNFGEELQVEAGLPSLEHSGHKSHIGEK